MSESASRTQPRTNDKRSATARERRFRVSRNRDQARHRVRYIESGGSTANAEGCPLCPPGEMNEQS